VAATLYSVGFIVVGIYYAFLGIPLSAFSARFAYAGVVPLGVLFVAFVLVRVHGRTFGTSGGDDVRGMLNAVLSAIYATGLIVLFLYGFLGLATRDFFKATSTTGWGAYGHLYVLALFVLLVFAGLSRPSVPKPRSKANSVRDWAFWVLWYVLVTVTTISIGICVEVISLVVWIFLLSGFVGFMLEPVHGEGTEPIRELLQSAAKKELRPWALMYLVGLLALFAGYGRFVYSTVWPALGGGIPLKVRVTVRDSVLFNQDAERVEVPNIRWFALVDHAFGYHYLLAPPGDSTSVVMAIPDAEILRMEFPKGIHGWKDTVAYSAKMH
jgi:hypothetical protein